MPYKFRRMCPLCGKQDLLYLADHLRQVHKLTVDERQPLLKAALFSHQVGSTIGPHVQPSMFYSPLQTGMLHPPPPKGSVQSMRRKQAVKVETNNCLETQTYPEFKFQHMFSMLVVGPSQCGKTYFVQQLLTKNCIEFPEKKPLQVYWFYNQWQPRYDEIKQVLKKKIRFTQGLPELSDNLQEINPVHNNILVFDDLMAQAADSPVLSRLFTQGRHRNASTILLLQNAFPKGKYNTDINRNATYKVLFRSPGDRKQIDITAEQTFAKDNFMKAYTKETEKPFGYIILDNHPRKSNEKQVVANVFGGCYTYPNITKTSSPSVQNSISSEEKPVKRKTESQIPTAKKQKRKAESQVSAVQKPKKQKKPKPIKKSAKKQKKPKPVKKSTRKPAKKRQPRFSGGFKKPAKQPKERFTGGQVSPDEEYESPEESVSEEPEEYEEYEESNEHESNIRPLTFEEELNEFARQTVENSRRGFRIH